MVVFTQTIGQEPGKILQVSFVPRPDQRAQSRLSTLSSIQHYMELHQGRTWLNRFLTKATTKESLQDFDLLLDQANQSFQVRSLFFVQ
jgi:hypothetical protein